MNTYTLTYCPPDCHYGLNEGPLAEHRRIDEVFEMLDSDGNGALQWEEFEAIT